MENQTLKSDRLKLSGKNLAIAFGYVALGVALGAGGIYVGDTDDAPGAALLGLLLMIGLVALAAKIVRRKG